MLRLRSTSAVLLSVAALNATLVSSSSANIVINGNFATGDYTGWTLGGDSSGDYITSGQLTGSDSQAALTTNGDDDGTLSQTVATTVGQTYQLSYLLGGDGATPNSFSSALGGVTLSSTSVDSFDLPAGTTYSYDYTATGSSSVLQFTYDDAPGFLYLTNVSLTAVATPEPASLALAALITLPLLRRRRERV